MLDKTAIMKEAQKYLEKGMVDKAISEWEKLLKENPDGNTYNIIGDLYLKKGNQKSAIDSYYQAANFFRREGFSPKALALYKKVLNLNQSHADSLYALGELSEEKNFITEAMKYYLAVADILSKEGNKDRLVETYKKILSISPTNIPLITKIAEIFLKEGFKKDAAIEYAKIANIYNEKADIEKAKEFYQKTLDNHPQNKEALMGLCLLFEKAGDFQHAIEQIKKAGILFPADMDILFRCAELSLAGGVPETAKESLTKIIKNDPGNIRSRCMLGDLYLKEGLREKAYETYLPVLDDMILGGQHDSAIKLFGIFREMDRTGITKRLAAIYSDLANKEMASSELTLLGDIFQEQGQEAEALSCYREALELSPDNDHLRIMIAAIVKEPEPAQEIIQEISEPEEELIEVVKAEEAVESESSPAPAAYESSEADISAEEHDISDYEDDIIEADFYMRQGLSGEALIILEKLHKLFPENRNINERLKSIRQTIPAEEADVVEPAGSIIIPENIISAETTDKSTESEPEIPEPALDSEVLEIFQEFKKGMNKELSEEDSETHYNLGIAYKEMGLIDDAINEFKLSKNDPGRIVQSSTMLASCYMEKGSFSHAIDVLKEALGRMREKNESYWTVIYDLAEAYEKNNNSTEALSLYSAVFSWNSKFRTVSDKISSIKAGATTKGDDKSKGKKDRVAYL